MKTAVRHAFLAAVAVAASVAASAEAAPQPPLQLPRTVKLPDLAPLIPNCADPAADRFLTLDMWKRAPAGATKVPTLNAWVDDAGVVHWPFVMRVRNIGDQPFVGKPGAQSAVVLEDDLLTKAKGRVVGTQAFDRIDPHGSLLVHFEFTAPRQAVESQRFHRIYSLELKFDESDEKRLSGKYGDCNPSNNKFRIEFDGGQRGWIVTP